MVTADGLGPAGGAAGGPGGVPEPSEERELRVLLERGVPQLAAPAQRLERVRERVRRRRRRRAAGVYGVLVAAVGTTGLLLLGAAAQDQVLGGGRPGAGPVEPGAAAPPPGAAASAPVRGPAPTSSGPVATDSLPPSRLVRFSEPRLTLRVPPDWWSRSVKGTVYVASAPILAEPAACADPLNGPCVPLRRPMATGGTLLALQVRSSPALAGKAGRAHPLTQTALGKACRVEGGTEQWYVLIGRAAPPAAGPSAVLTGSVCLDRPASGQLQTILALLTGADFS